MKKSIEIKRIMSQLQPNQNVSSQVSQQTGEPKMNSMLQAVGKNLNITQDDLDQYKNSLKKSINLDGFPKLINNEGLVIDGLDESLFDDMMKEKVPIDMWGFVQWERFWKRLYEQSFKKPYPYNRQQFNYVFSGFMHKAQDEYSLSNDEIKKYLIWFANYYMSYLEKYNKPFNFRSLEYKIGDFYEREIRSIINKEKINNVRLRNLPINPKDLKGSIDVFYNDHCDLLLKQLGFPIMLYYNMKWVYGEDPTCKQHLIDCIKNRCTIEKNINGSVWTEYMSSVIETSIYMGPYPFESKFKKIGIEDWRDVFRVFIKKYNIEKKEWWLNCYPERDAFEGIKIFSRKRKIVRRST